MSEFIEKHDQEAYTIKASKMSPGQKVECPDKTTEIEKIDEDTVKLICKKGTCVKVTV